MTRRLFRLFLCLSLAIFCLDRSRVAADDGPLLPGFENASTDEPAVEEPSAEPRRQVPRPIAPPPSAPSRNVPSRSAPVTRGLDSDIEPPVDDRSSQPGQSSRRGYSHGPRGVGSADAPAKPDAVDRQPASPSNGVQPMDPSSRRGPSDPAVPRGQGVPPRQRMQPNQQQRAGIGGKGYDMRRSQPSAKPGTQPERAGPESPPRAGWGQPFGRPNNQGSQAPQRQPNSSHYRSAPPQTRPYPQAPSQSPGRATQSERSQARGPLGWQLPGAAGRAPKSSAIPNQPAPSNRSTAIPPWETNGHGLR